MIIIIIFARIKIEILFHILFRDFISFFMKLFSFTQQFLLREKTWSSFR